MKELVVDTSVWIQSFREKAPPTLAEALKGGRVILAPLVLAELLSGIRNASQQNKLNRFLSYIPLHPVGRAHWQKVGSLRARLAAKGLSVSIPDCHIAQCALECDGILMSFDKIFSKMASSISALSIFEFSK
ncbi:MAG: PIN domain-containing protein [Deltaproteobacteria bacterium]|nr:PIN domain-containing protein [Deltaproteobacteria bacterium]